MRAGLAGVYACETTISECQPDGRLSYRGIALADLVGKIDFGEVWGLLVDDNLHPGLPPAEPFPLPVHTGDIRVDVQSALAQLSPIWGFQPLFDITATQAREDLARASVMALSFIAQSARGQDQPMVSQRTVDQGQSAAERFMIRWRGEPDPTQVAALDAYWVALAEHGLAPSTLAARVIASTGADVAACLSGAVGAMSGPLHGGAPARALQLIRSVDRGGDPLAQVHKILDSGGRLMGFGHRIYRGPDPRAELLKQAAARLQAPYYEAARALEQVACAELQERHPGRGIWTNVEFWASVMLDFAGVPPAMFTPMFACARTAGWSAHILEEQREGRMMRPLSHYRGPQHRAPHTLAGWPDRG
ncbi:MAG: citrate synthase 2 [Angustibacter sp.]